MVPDDDAIGAEVDRCDEDGARRHVICNDGTHPMDSPGRKLLRQCVQVQAGLDVQRLVLRTQLRFGFLARPGRHRLNRIQRIQQVVVRLSKKVNGQGHGA